MHLGPKKTLLCTQCSWMWPQHRCVANERSTGVVYGTLGGLLKRERLRALYCSSPFPFFSSGMSMGRLRLPAATWDQEVTLRMEVTCQKREAGRQRKSVGVPHDWELPISLDDALGTPLTQEREELPLCSNHGRFGFSVTWRYQISKNYIRCCLFGGGRGTQPKSNCLFFFNDLSLNSYFSYISSYVKNT